MPIETSAEAYKARQQLIRRSILRERSQRNLRARRMKSARRKAYEYTPKLPAQEKIAEAGVPRGAREAEASGLPLDWTKIPWLARRKEKHLRALESRLRRRPGQKGFRSRSGVFQSMPAIRAGARQFRERVMKDRREQEVARLKRQRERGSLTALKPMGWRPSPVVIPRKWLNLPGE